MADLFTGTGIAHTILLFAVVIALGLFLGRFKIKGVSIGSTWILFIGIILSHFGFRANPTALSFIKDFGLILFVFSIGLQVGPGFFHSFRKGGVTMNLLAVGMVLMAGGMAILIHYLTGERLDTMVGVMSGAVTNTPGLGAAQQTLSDVLVAEGISVESAGEAASNYNFSDPDSAFNTPFQGRPDSIVFWAKYIPGDRDAAKEVNQARMSTIITTNARYQDPELNNDSIKHADFRMGAATLNYSATADLGWQRLAVPFVYTKLAETENPAYILATFTTNKLPGGGTGTKDKPDSVFIDDVELVYNNSISLLARGEDALEFNGEAYQINETYCDSCGEFSSIGTGISTQAFYAFDAIHKCVFVYVIADDYAQSGKYNLYRVDFTDTNAEGTSTDPKEPEHQGIENVYSGNARFEKVLINGQLFIRSADAWYNAAGVRVK